MRLVQISHPDHGIKVALVREPFLVLMNHGEGEWTLLPSFDCPKDVFNPIQVETGKEETNKVRSINNPAATKSLPQ